jgi:hypothetical protein
MKVIDEAFSYIENRNYKNAPRIVLGKIESAKENDYDGHSYFVTGLVPFFEVDRMVSQEDEVNRHFTVSYNGPVAIEDRTDLFFERFFINSGYDSTLGFEPLALSWSLHNKVTYLPSSNLLASHQLVMRTAGERVYWDDPSLPYLGVVSVQPTSTYKDGRHSLAVVDADSRYVEDYAFRKKCAVFEFYFEERWLGSEVPEIEDFIGDIDGKMVIEPGRQIKILKPKSNRGVYNIQIWGRRLVLFPQKQPISTLEKTILDWPDLKPRLSEQDVWRSTFDYIYLKDTYLILFEESDGYSINPESGSVGYQGWWGLSSCQRVGRNYIRMELKKLYEGTPDSIIRQLNEYAVSKSIVDQDVKKYGNRNIGIRAKELVLSMVQLFVTLSEFMDSLGLYYDEIEICSFSLEAIYYSGWFADRQLCKLGNCVEVEISESTFLNRCVSLVSFLESIKEKPLRALLKKIGVQTEQIKDLRSLKLLEIVVSLAETSEETGLTFIDSSAEILARTDTSRQNQKIKGLIYLNDIRVYASHKSSVEMKQKYRTALEHFSIVTEDANTIGWGTSLDRVYDNLVDEFRVLRSIISLAKGANIAS